MKKHRARAQDVAKGIMIIGVIFFHCYLMTFENHAEAIQSFNITMAILPYIMGAFFFYTGYNYKINGKSAKENILKRAKQLLIPMVIAFVISAVLISAMELAFNHSDVGTTFQAIGNSLLYGLMSEPLALMIHFPQSGGIVFELILALGLLWFLYALFICSVFFFLLVNYTNKKLSTLISVVIGLLVLAFCLGQFVGTYLPYTVQSYPVILAIMLTASYLRQKHFIHKKLEGKKDIILHGINMVLAESIIILTCVFCYYQFGSVTTGSLPGGMFDAKLKGFDAIIAYVFAIIGTYFIHMLCRLIKHIPVVGNCLKWVGHHSAIFYLFHPVFLDLAAIVIFQKKVPWGRAQTFVYVAVVVLLLTGVCLLMDLIFKKRHPEVNIEEEIHKLEAPEEPETPEENEAPIEKQNVQ